MTWQDAAALSRLLRLALVAGVESAVKVHIHRGDDLNARDSHGQTPLMLSAARNNAAICALLLNAGADAGLLDPSGRSALTIAVATGSQDAARILETSSSSAAPATLADAESEQYPLDGAFLADRAPTPPVAEEPRVAFADSAFLLAPAHIPMLRSFPSGDGFDLTGWEAEEDRQPPASDSTLAAAAFELQCALTGHQPIDTSTDWDDFAAFLPEQATPLTPTDDAEAREQLRLVLLRAIREGSVPQSAVDDLALGDDGEPDGEAVALLSMVVNDLGAETDERFEYCAPHESFRVFVAPEEKPDEEVAVAEALAFVDDLASRRNDPLRIYQREFRREGLLTAEAEVALGQGMERGLEKALDALVSWPSGIRAALEAAQRVSSGAMPLRWLSAGTQADLQDRQRLAGPEIDVEAPPATGSLADADGADEDDNALLDPDTKSLSDELAEFRTSAELLAGLVRASGEPADRHALRGAIAALGLTRNFLLELAYSELGGASGAASAFKHAMGDYRCARDKLATANLKLVFSIAKKYMFSGQPLDDLLQEGNIGLLKAVDKYDWRRGFKFSTYATWWIRQQVGRFVADKGKAIRLPVHVYEKTQRIAHAAHGFELERGRAPSLDEIATLVDLPIRKVDAFVRASQEPLSTETLGNLGALVAADAAEQFTARDPMDIVADAQLVSLIDRFLGELALKEARVLRMRFGIGIYDAMTLEEIGMRLDVTRERIRQIEAAALRKLKHPSRLSRLQRDLDKVTQKLDVATESRANSTDELTAAAIESELNDGRDKPSCSATERSTVSVPPALDELLEQARLHGVAVDDENEYGARKILVRLTDTLDNRSHDLVRRLIAMGFEYRPGKGYFR